MQPTKRSVTDELAALVFALDEGALETAAITAHITQAIVRWAIERGWSVRREARVAVGDAATSTGQLGFVDVLVRRGGSEPDLAIEIDSSQKPWSLAKLRHAAESGMHAIWIRWGDDDWPGVYDDVDVIQLRLARSPGRRPDAPQLPLWPTQSGSARRRKSMAFLPTTPSTTD